METNNLITNSFLLDGQSDHAESNDSFSDTEKSSNSRFVTNNLLQNIICALSEYNIDGYLITSRDEFNSEYAPSHNQRLEAVSRFSGSFGQLVIMKNYGILYTDGRYTLQAKNQIDLNYFIIKDFSEFLQDSKTILKDKKIGYDPRMLSDNFRITFQDIEYISLLENLVDKYWENRPKKEDLPFFAYDIKYAGQSSEEKLSKLVNRLSEMCVSDTKNPKYLQDSQNRKIFFISLDPLWICWLLNIRGRDVKNTPVLLSYLIIELNLTSGYTVNLYTDSDCNNSEKLEIDLRLKKLSRFYIDLEQLSNLSKNNDNIIFIYEDEFLNNSLVSKTLNSLPQIRYNATEFRLWQSCKNSVEINCMRNGHIDDAIALIEAFSHIEELIISGSKINEYEIGLKLSEFRHSTSLKPFALAEYIGESFDPICGYQANGAVIHYKADRETCLTLKNNGLLLIDSGGQYKGATTDVTRVLSFENITNKQKDLYTRVLMGHIDLFLYKIKNFDITKNDSGNSFREMDNLARSYLKEIELNYSHGTGHGVGSFLSVHEAPISIHSRSNIPIMQNMVFSNEPGVYVEGEFGIRIENLVYTEFTPYSNGENIGTLKSKNLTLIPYNIDLINLDLLTSQHKKYLKDYYEIINSTLRNKLSAKGSKWLSYHTDI